VRITATSRPSRIVQVTKDDRKAYRISVFARDRDRYTSDAQRTELGQGNPARPFGDGTGSRRMRAGDDRWVAEQILIPAGAPTGDQGNAFVVLNQFKIDGPGGPTAALSFEDNRLVVSRAASREPGDVDQVDLGRSAVVPRDRWLRVVWHVRWSTASDGLIEVFTDFGHGDGSQRIAGYRGWTLKQGATGRPALVHPRIGIYRRAVNRDTSIYFSGYAVATSRAGAELSAGT
jgi:hypothetical protein